MKRLTLELGGKSPNVIFEDCDLEEAVNWALHGLFMNSGQVCAANTRLYVHAKIYEQFLEKFKNKAQALPIGTAFEPGMYIGPLMSQAQMDVSTFL